MFRSVVLRFCLSLIATTSVVVAVAGDDLLLGGGDRKQLVVFAGPHKTSETNVEAFYYKFARGDHPDLHKQEALRGWSWPQVLGLGSPHKVYDRLVTDPDNADIKEKIIGKLVTHLETSSRGLIIGGDEYDRVGNTIWSNWDATAAINSITTATGIQKEDVTIVLLYLRPRVEQWLSIFTHDILEERTEVRSEKFRSDYDEFLCNPETADQRFETLETVMNPFLLSTLYVDAGYNVVMIDLEGARGAGLKAQHVIGCEILGGTCNKDGWLKGLEKESFTKYHELYDESNHPFHSLSVAEVEQLEHLMWLRDCNYQNTIVQHDKFKFLYANDVFAGCPSQNDNDDLHKTMKELTDTAVLFNAIQSQKNCNADDVSLQTMLGSAPELDDANFLKYSDHRAEDASVLDLVATPAVNTAGGDVDVDGNDNDNGNAPGNAAAEGGVVGDLKDSDDDNKSDVFATAAAKGDHDDASKGNPPEVGAVGDLKDSDNSEATANPPAAAMKGGSDDTMLGNSPDAGHVDDLQDSDYNAANVVLAAPTTEGDSDNNDKRHHNLVLQSVLGAVTVLWIGFMMYSQWKKKRDERYIQGSLDGIIPTLIEDRNRPLSLIM